MTSIPTPESPDESFRRIRDTDASVNEQLQAWAASSRKRRPEFAAAVDRMVERLRQHGATYSDLLDGVRKDHARRALRDTQLGISELAHRLGFAHPPAFHRAFRRWFGVTPNMYREVKSEHPAARFWRPR